MILALLFIVFIIVPFIELWLILQVGDIIGAGPTIALLIADSMLGAWLMRNQGRAVWKQFQDALNAGKLPAREVINGGFVILGGVFLLLPGFISDFVGLLMLLPPTRKVFGNLVFRFVSRRVRLATGAADTGLQDFPRSSQPRRPKPGPTGGAEQGQSGDPTDSDSRSDEDPEFDFETRRLNN
jgi:UPF0716 protein FxsA